MLPPSGLEESHTRYLHTAEKVTFSEVCHQVSSEALILVTSVVSTDKCKSTATVCLKTEENSHNKAQPISCTSINVFISFKGFIQISLFQLDDRWPWFKDGMRFWEQELGHYLCMCAAPSREHLSWQQRKWLCIHSQRSNVLQLKPAALCLSSLSEFLIPELFNWK